MNKFRSGLVFLFVITLAGCGGNNDVPGKPKFAAQVSFGDSLSDVGSYDVGAVSFYGGGQFTINAASTVKATTPTNWTEFTSLSLGLGMPCAAQTGLNDGTGTPSATYVMPPVDHAGCTGYAQGGSRVTSLYGVGNHLVTTGGFALTVPVGTQIQNFLTAHAGSFSGKEIVTVMAGANDVFIAAGSVGTGGYTATSGVIAVQTAASQLAADVKTNILANGAKFVVVVNVPDISSTPQVTSIADPTIKANTKGLFDALVGAFNTQLKADLPDSATVLNVDAFSASKDEVANPLKYNLTNVADTACNLATPTPNPFASSLGCNASNLNAGVTASSHYLFADKVHPTPYGHLLFATYVLQAMTNKGWY
jgi:outer membrane lipase/esterase